VVVVPVVRRDLPVYLEWLATLTGSVNADVRPRVQGYLTAVDYPEGTHVRAGQLLFTIDDRTYRAAVQAAQGDLAAAKAAVLRARQDVARYEPLAARHAVSQQELDQARAALASGQGDVQAREAALRQAELNLQWTRVESPISGLAGTKRFDVGSLVGPDNVLTTVSQVDPMQATFAISEAEYLRVAPLVQQLSRGGAGPEVSLVLSDGRLYPYPARVVTAERQIDPRTGTLPLQAYFPNPQGLLRPGLTARVRMRTEEGNDVLVVPQRALQEIQGRYQVAVVGPGDVVDVRPVEVGARVGDLAVIRSGVREGEQVVLEGGQSLRDGARVRPQPPSPPASG
jgi:membrane fusion protein (multidrug efflux system)